jgi:hypothetical protein
VSEILENADQANENKRVHAVTPHQDGLSCLIFASPKQVIHIFFTFHAHSLLHFFQPQLRIRLAPENPLALSKALRC